MRQAIIIGDILCTNHIHGISRYAYEIIKELDPLVVNLKVSICYPKGEKVFFDFLENISLIPLEVKKGRHFRKDVIKKYVKKTNGFVIDFGPGFTYYKKSIVTFHDVRPLEKLGFDSVKENYKLRLMLLLAKYHKSTQVITVSNYQKNRIHILANFPLDRIEVIGNGWEHVLNIKPDEKIFDKFPMIRKEEYCYALGSVAPHKNYQWIYEVAKNNKDRQFVVAGNIDLANWGIDDSGWELENIIFTGYISDEENVALMKACKVFVHPSKYEGFGIPPLEAIALGKNAVISNATCLPEVFGSAVEYFNPDDYSIDLEQYNGDRKYQTNELLKKHSWSISAKKWMEIIHKMAVN